MEVEPKVFHSIIQSYCFVKRICLSPPDPGFSQYLHQAFEESTGIKVKSSFLDGIEKCTVSDPKFLTLLTRSN